MKTDKISLILEAVVEGPNINGEEAAAAGLEYEAENGAVMISKYTGDAATLAIPARIDGVPVTAIGDSAFAGRAALTSVTIPAGVMEISDSAFADCAALTSVSIPAGVMEISDATFIRCTALASITILESVTKIGWFAFKGCTALTGITLPASITEIGDEAFKGCAALTSITVAEGNANYRSIDGVLFNKDGTTLVQYPGGKKGAYTVPTGVTEIGDEAFFRCSGLTSVTMPASIKKTGIFAFDECPALTSITAAEGNANYKSIDGVLFNKDGTTLIQYPGGKKGAYTVPAGVTKIGGGAFFYCPALTGITVAEGNVNYKSIDGVLFNKDGTTLVLYPGGKKGAYTIPEGVTEIGGGAFFGCTALTGITVPASVTEISGDAFADCTVLKTVTLSRKTKAKRAFPNDVILNFIDEMNKNSAGLGVKEVKHIVAAFLKTTASKIADWKKLGGSHNVYSFCVDGEKYVVRWFEHTNTRQVKAEKAAYSAIKHLGISDEVLYFDKAGVKIARYLDGKTLNRGKRDQADTLALLREIHQSGRTIPECYNIFAMIADYSANLCSQNPAKGEVLRRHGKDIDTIKAAFDTLNVTPVLCQGDACAGNFLRLKDGSLRLLDWEQALMADPFLDLAIAALNQGYGKARIAWGLAQYLRKEPNVQETYRMHACIALGGFMLAAWAAGEHYDDGFKSYLDRAAEAAHICSIIQWIKQRIY